MSEMNHTPNSADSQDSAWLDTLDGNRSNLFTQGAALAREYELMLNELAADVDFDNQIGHEIMTELDARAGHLTTPCLVTGNIIERDYTVIDSDDEPDEDGTIRQPYITGGDQIFVENKELVSHGYVCKFETDDDVTSCRVYHLASGPAERVDTLSVPGVITCFAQRYYLLPIDGTVEVVPQEIDEPELGTGVINLYAPESMLQIEEAILNVDSHNKHEVLSNALRRLSTIDINNEPNLIADPQLIGELTTYIDQLLELDKDTLYEMRKEGTILVLGDDKESLIGGAVITRRQAFHGVVTGIHAARLAPDAPLQLCLGMQIPTTASTWQSTIIPLTDSLSLEKCNQLSIHSDE